MQLTRLVPPALFSMLPQACCFAQKQRTKRAAHSQCGAA